MAQKISQMITAGTLNGTELLEIVQGGVNKKIDLSTLTGFGTLSEAPQDGLLYGRQDGAWAVIPTAGGEVSENPEDAHQHWRILVEVTENNDAAYIAEVGYLGDIDGADQALTGTPSVSSSFSATYDAAKAHDNNSNTFWRSLDPLPQWIAYDFGSPVFVEAITIEPKQFELGRAPSQFKVQFSNDGVNWTDAWTETGVTGWAPFEEKKFIAPYAVPPVREGLTTTDTALPTDAGKITKLSNVDDITATIPPDTFELGDTLTYVQWGAGAILLNAGVGVTLHPAPGYYAATAGRYSMMSAVMIEANVWVVTGQLSAVPPGSDPNIDNVELLLGFNGASWLTDESKNAFTLTPQGTFSQAVGGGIEGDGATATDTTTSSGASIPDNVAFDLTGAFTIECFFKLSPTGASGGGILGKWLGGTSWRLRSSGANVIFEFELSDGISGTSTAENVLSTSAFAHICIDRNLAGEMKFYVDGVVHGTVPEGSAPLAGSTGALWIKSTTGADGRDDIIDEVRITKDVARYDSDAGFTPPAVPFPRT